MNRPYYLRAGLLLLLASCGDPAASGGEPSSDQGGPSPFAGAPQPPYLAVEREQLTARYLDHLLYGSRASLRFAREALGERGEVAVPLLVNALEAELSGEASVRAVNLLSALVFTRTKQDLPVLMDILELHPLPVVRSQAYDTIGLLGMRALVPALIQRVEAEGESGPTRRLISCLGQLGGAEVATFLADMTRSWLSVERRAPAGVQAWGTLLTMEDEEALDQVEALLDLLPAPQRAQALVRLLQGGRSGYAEEVREFLDPERYPSGLLRRMAVEGLALAEDWEAVSVAGRDPDPAVRLAVVDAFRSEAAVAQGMGTDFLLELANQDETMAMPALRALVERGITQPLEPWVAKVRDYPAQGSVTALRLFLDGEVHHPQLARILISRWPYCVGDQKIDLMRVLSASGDLAAVPFLEGVVRSKDASSAVRLHAIVSLGNFGPDAVPALLRLWQEDPAPAAADRMLNALLRYPNEEGVRELVSAAATQAETRDDIRALALRLLVPALREDAYPVLLEAREKAVRGEVKVYIEGILRQYF